MVVVKVHTLSASICNPSVLVAAASTFAVYSSPQARVSVGLRVAVALSASQLTPAPTSTRAAL